MSPTNNEYYCGLPEILWDQLNLEAEDLFIEEEIGSHILGVYPAGSRIYGIESSSQGLFYLYVDTIESLINPNNKKNKRFKKYTVGNQNSPVYFMELYKWAEWLILENDPNWKRNFFDLIPTYHDIVYQDNNIDSIIAAAQGLANNNIVKIASEPWPTCPGAQTKVSKRELLNYSLYLRTVVIQKTHRQFCPNINPEWDKVISLSNMGEKLSQIDKQIITAVVNNTDIDYIDFNTYIDTLKQIISSNIETNKEKNYKMKEELGKQIASFYRYQL